MIGDKVGDYTVIESTVIGNAKFVVGESPENPITPYATWQANIKNDPHSYFWGHYCTDKLGAMEDYGKRISDEAERQRSFLEKRSQQKPDIVPER